MGKGLCIIFSVALNAADAETESKRKMRLAYVIRRKLS